MDLKTLTNMFPSHKLVMNEQYAQEHISTLKTKTLLNWSDTIFVNCDFTEAQFHLMMVSSAIFFQCDFSGASLRACDIEGCEFISCNMTCCDLQGSFVSDTTFTDCIIGGIRGPVSPAGVAFFFPRYSRNLPLTSQAPYYVMTTPEELVYVFRTENDWRIHGLHKRLVVGLDNIEEAEEPYRAVLQAVATIEQKKIDLLRIDPNTGL
ncbi:pentapeptide repeat-containing protein [Kordiimonas aquimaris]|uniref:pentapeptide repeat-containing protein n=1 Tax=Kordiimonas aquimaris TaxID=707591 RepID=UPI0021D0FF32|nr:pentapeptide repeat-containing protein [Kordiimonas aquimaris]